MSDGFDSFDDEEEEEEEDEVMDRGHRGAQAVGGGSHHQQGDIAGHYAHSDHYRWGPMWTLDFVGVYRKGLTLRIVVKGLEWVFFQRNNFS